MPNIRRTAANTTARLVEILRPALDNGIITPAQLPRHFGPFPVAGLAYYSHDFGFPRYTPHPHLHEGTDIFADEGTPIVASGPGVVMGKGDQAVGGLSVWVAYDNGDGMYYTHMSAFPPELQLGMRVDTGTTIGYVGRSGNAAGTAPHLHVEIHAAIRNSRNQVTAGGVTTLPNGQGSSNTPAVDPKATLDGWLRQAEENAGQFVAASLQAYAEIPKEAHISRRVRDLFSVDPAEDPSGLIWLSAAQPEVGMLGIASKEAAEARLTAAVGSLQQRSAEQQRLAIVRQAVQAPSLQMSTLTGIALYEPSDSSKGPS